MLSPVVLAVLIVAVGAVADGDGSDTISFAPSVSFCVVTCPGTVAAPVAASSISFTMSTIG